MPEIPINNSDLASIWRAIRRIDSRLDTLEARKPDTLDTFNDPVNILRRVRDAGQWAGIDDKSLDLLPDAVATLHRTRNEWYELAHRYHTERDVLRAQHTSLAGGVKLFMEALERDAEFQGWNDDTRKLLKAMLDKADVLGLR